MADQTVNYNTVSDLPEYIKPYEKILLNAVTGTVFNPAYTASQLGANGTPGVISGGTQTNSDPSQQSGMPVSPIQQQATDASGIASPGITSIASPGVVPTPADTRQTVDQYGGG